MVLTQTVGKQRPFVRGLFLTIFTFGIYGIYWQYKAHDELYKQFEMQKDGRDEGVVWLILGLVLFPLQFVYAWMFVGNVQYIRERLQLPAGISPGKFLGIQITAYAIFFVGYIALIASTLGMDTSSTAPADSADLDPVLKVLPYFFLGLLVYLGILAYAFYRLQTDINGVWDAYQRRMHELTAPPAATAAGAVPSGYTYWGDLRPAAPQLSAPHLRMRVDAFQRQHPEVALPGELPGLLLRGEAGDASALTAAAALLDGVDRRANERVRLRAELEDLEGKQARLAGRLANGEVDAAAYAAARAELDRQRERAEARLHEASGGSPPV